MHRLLTIPAECSDDRAVLVEQPCAPVLFLTSAQTDISTLDTAITLSKNKNWIGQIRALPLTALEHPAQIDHYIETTASGSTLIIVRLLGGRGHWSYGLDKLKAWQEGLVRKVEKP